MFFYNVFLREYILRKICTLHRCNYIYDLVLSLQPWNSFREGVRWNSLQVRDYSITRLINKLEKDLGEIFRLTLVMLILQAMYIVTNFSYIQFLIVDCIIFI